MAYKIALTGATGFIGRAIAQRLVSNGWQVQALVRPASIHKRPTGMPVRWIKGDLGDLESLRALVCGADAVVHCAGVVRGFSQMDFDRTNSDGVARLVLAANEENPPPRFLLISSLAAREPQLSHYAASKRKGEAVLSAQNGKMAWSAFRPPAVYGPEDRELLPLFHLMTKGVAPLIGSDANRFSLLHVWDLADAVCCWLRQEVCPGRVYEVHDGRAGGYAWKDVIAIMSKVSRTPPRAVRIPVNFLRALSMANLPAARFFGRAPMLTPGKIRELVHQNWVADNTSITHDTKWAPKVSLEEGLRRLFRRGALPQGGRSHLKG